MTKWTRRLEFVSLTGLTLTIPIFLTISGILTFFYLLPSTNPIIGYPLIFILIFMGISWNTRFGVGGRTTMTAFIHYLKNTENEGDRSFARRTLVTIFLWPFLLIILIGVFFRIFFVK